MVKSKKKLNNKKKLIYIIVSIALFFAIVNGSIFIFNSINSSNTKNQNIAVSDKPAADKLHAMAVEALETNKTQAKALFQTARRQYEYILENTTEAATRDYAQMRIKDCDAQLWLLEHQ